MDKLWPNLLRECIVYGMKPNEYWQCSPQDVFTFVAINRPPEMVGKITKKQFNKAAKMLEEFEAKKGLSNG